MALLDLAHVTKHYRNTRAVEGVSLSLEQGETLGLVGESGCGKSTLGRLALGLEEADEGRIFFRGAEITRWGYDRWRGLRRNMQMIFQNPLSSLNPLFTVEKIIGEPLTNYEKISKEEMKIRVGEMMTLVGLEPGLAGRRPHELSGGQRQRVGIARALILKPELVVCDEAVSSLDFIIRGQILALLREMKEQFGLTYLFIAHDLGAVKQISDRVAVMYLGKIVEIIRTERIREDACHPYTRALLEAVPVSDPTLRKNGKTLIKGELPPAGESVQGCGFHSRCPYAERVCCEQTPVLEKVNPLHQAACHRVLRLS